MKSCLVWIGIIAFLGFIIYRLNEGDKISSVDPTGKVTFEKDQSPKGKIDLNGNWSMLFDFSQCNSVHFKNKNIQTKYTINIIHQGYDVKGEGEKVSEIREGKEIIYKQSSPISFKGRIQGDLLSLDFYESNTQEVTGKITIPFGSKNFKLAGEYKASGNNCDGPILLQRVTKKVEK